LIVQLFRRLIHPLETGLREKINEEIVHSSSPSFDFFLLVFLSGSIATFGLLTDSAAVIIGAMLVAPLMSPIIGIGLATVTGDSHLLRSALKALFQGAVLAVSLAALITLINTHLPILSFQQLPNEVLTRTRPTPIDLVIALAGGLAAAYALTQPRLSAALPGVAIATALMPPLCTVGVGVAFARWDVAGGAFLLFLTNAVTIAFASAFVFFVRGFGGKLTGQNHRMPRSLIFSASLLLVLFVPLNYYSIRFFQEASENRRVSEVINDHIHALGDAELLDMKVNHDGDALDMELTIRTGSQLRYQQVVSLQETIVEELNRPVSLKVNQIFAERLDPLIPPPSPATSTITTTPTPGPSPTGTDTLVPTATHTSTLTETPLPSPTASFTPTPQDVGIVSNLLPAMSIYQSPGGPVIGSLRPRMTLKKLYREQVYGGLVWIEVQDSEGRIGWIPAVYAATLIPSRTPTATIAPSLPAVTHTVTPSEPQLTPTGSGG